MPSIANLLFTCACYALLGYALARVRWWLGLPFLLFLALTLSATFKRLDDARVLGRSAEVVPHYLAYHGLGTAVAAAVILLGIRAQRRRRAIRAHSESVAAV
jgi:hypothetical protein